MEELLLAAAECFKDGRSPFEDDWLVEHKVTYTECMDLSDLIGTACEHYVRVNRRARDLVARVASGGE